MLRLFALDNTQFNSDSDFTRAYAAVSPERRERVDALPLRGQKNACLAAGVILPLALSFCGYGGGVESAADERGKPYLISPKGVHFNLSHSGNFTVIALSDHPVGVDVQQKKPIDLRVAQRFFTSAEAVQANDGEQFYRIWTVKESYLKALGVGLTRPLSSFEVVLGERTEIVDKMGEKKWKIYESNWLEGYALAVCSAYSRPDLPPEFLRF